MTYHIPADGYKRIDLSTIGPEVGAIYIPYRECGSHLDPHKDSGHLWKTSKGDQFYCPERYSSTRGKFVMRCYREGKHDSHYFTPGTITEPDIEYWCNGG